MLAIVFWTNVLKATNQTLKFCINIYKCKACCIFFLILYRKVNSKQNTFFDQKQTLLAIN